MKRNIFSVLLVCLMIVSMCILSGCKTDELEAQINENASAAEGAVSDAISKAEGDVNAAAKEAAANLAAAKEELTKLIADGAAADADALDAAVAEFNAAIADIEAVMAAGEEAAKDHDEAAAAELAALKAELTTALEDATQSVAGAAAQNLAAVKAELLAAIAAGNQNSSDDISSAVAKAVENLTALITTVEKTNMEYADSLKAELEDKLSTAYIEISDWTSANADVSAAVKAVATKYYSINRDLYYAKNLVELDIAYDTALVTLSRVTNKTAAAEALALCLASIDAVNTKADVIKAVLTANGSLVDDVVHNDVWNKAITDAEALIAAETDDDVKASLKKVDELTKSFRTRYDVLEPDAADAAKLNEEVVALTGKITTDGFTAEVKELYAALKGSIAKWLEATNDANKVLLDSAKVEALDKAYSDAEAAYNKAATDVKATLDALASYTFGAENYEAVIAAKDAYEKWIDDVEARGFAVEGEAVGAVEKATIASYAKFEKVHARALALQEADTRATKIETDIAALVKNIESIKNGGVVKSQYQADLLAIQEARAKWIEDYFSGDYAAEAVAGNANYEILNHQALVDLETLYNEVMKEIMDLAEALKLAIAKVENITVFSGADLDAAYKAYIDFTDRLVDLEYQIDGLKDAADISKAIAEKNVKYKALVAEAVAAYNELKVVKKDQVNLSSKNDIDALVKWYKDYAKVDLNGDGTIAETLVLDKITIDATTVAEAKAAIAAFKELDAAKAKELEALKKEINDLVALKPSTDLRDKITTALANYTAWLEGTGATRPAGYDKEDYVPAKKDALDAEKAKLDKLSEDVAALEETLKELLGKVDKLVVDYTKLDTAEKRTEAQTTLNNLKKEIADFTASNNKVDCFKDKETTLANAQVAIDLATAVAEFVAKNAALLEKLDNNLDVNNEYDAKVKANMIARAEAVLKAAEVAITTNNKAGIELAEANFELFNKTIDSYIKYRDAAGADTTKAALAYEAYDQLDRRVDMTSASQKEDELNWVDKIFTAVFAEKE